MIKTLSVQRADTGKEVMTSWKATPWQAAIEFYDLYPNSRWMNVRIVYQGEVLNTYCYNSKTNRVKKM